MMLRLAAIQAPAYCVGRGAVTANTASIRPLLLEAARQGARFALLPELSLQGYSYLLPETWKTVDKLPMDLTAPVDATAAPAAAALCSLAKDSGMHVGATVLEYLPPEARDAASRGKHGDVLNTFIVATPEGRLHGEASSKVIPAHFEAYVFTSGRPFPSRRGRVLSIPSLAASLTPVPGQQRRPKLDTVRLGVSICNDNYNYDSLAELAASTPRADLIVAPHAAMVPGETLGFPAAESVKMRKAVQSVAANLAAILGLPAVSTNATGSWPASEKLPWIFAPLTGIQLRNAAFPGAGCIAAPSSGAAGSPEVIACVGHDGSGVAVADVQIGGHSAAADIDAASLQARVAAATKLGSGTLCLPALLARAELLNAGSGRLWYRWNGEQRDGAVGVPLQ